MEIGRLTRDGTAEPVSRDQVFRHARGQGNISLPCSADHEQDWQPYPVDPYSAICDDHTYIQLHNYFYYVLKHVFDFVFVWCPCMSINLSVQHNNGGFLPGIICKALTAEPRYMTFEAQTFLLNKDT